MPFNLLVDCEIVVTARHRLPQGTIVSNQEIGEEVVVVVDQVAAVDTEATMVVHMEDRMEGRHQVQTGGATSSVSSS